MDSFVLVSYKIFMNNPDIIVKNSCIKVHVSGIKVYKWAGSGGARL